jgi:hypothetical protein
MVCYPKWVRKASGFESVGGCFLSVTRNRKATAMGGLCLAFGW